MAPPAASVPTTTEFRPEMVTLDEVGASITVTVATDGIRTGAGGVQVNVQHSDLLAITQAACIGIFMEAIAIDARSVEGGTLMDCFLLSNETTETSGDVMSFLLSRVGDSQGEEVVTFALGGSMGTQYSQAGRSIDPGAVNQLTVR